MSDELKPCICGKYLYYEKTSLGIDAHCTNKKCALYGKQFEWLNVEAWNTRPLEDALRAELAAAREAIEYTLSQLEYMRMLWGGEGVTDGIAQRLKDAMREAQP